MNDVPLIATISTRVSNANAEEDQLLPQEADEIPKEGNTHATQVGKNSELSTTNTEEDQLLPDEPGKIVEERNEYIAQAAKDVDDNQVGQEPVPPPNQTEVNRTRYG